MKLHLQVASKYLCLSLSHSPGPFIDSSQSHRLKVGTRGFRTRKWFHLAASVFRVCMDQLWRKNYANRNTYWFAVPFFFRSVFFWGAAKAEFTSVKSRYCELGGNTKRNISRPTSSVQKEQTFIGGCCCCCCSPKDVVSSRVRVGIGPTK